MMRIKISFENSGDLFSAHLVLPSGSYSVAIPPPLTMSLQESFRGLRWKAAGLENKGDVLLIEVGIELAQLLFPAGQRSVWKVVSNDESKYLELHFSPGSLQLLQFPWELLYLDGRFLLSAEGSTLVRFHSTEFSSSPVGPLRVLAVSLGTDDGLDYQEERKHIAGALGAKDEVKFLLDPPPDELQRAVSDLRPSVLHISGHGGFDDLEAAHFLFSDNHKFRTASVLRDAAENQVQLVILSTCEGGKVPIEMGVPQTNVPFPVDVVGYNYPVDDATSVRVSAVLYSALARGEEVVSAVAAVRSLRSEDVFSFFNITHLHTSGAPFFQATSRDGPAKNDISDSPRLIGRESLLRDLARRSSSSAAISILAPVGIGATTLARNWGWLEPRLVGRSSGKRLSLAVTRPHQFRAKRGPLVILDGLPDRSSRRLITELPGGLRAAVASHPFRAFPQFLSDIRKENIPVAERGIIDANRIVERISGLTEPGKRLLAILLAVRGATSWGADDAPELLRMSKSDFATAKRELTKSKVAFMIDGSLRLSPDIHIAGKLVLPDFPQLVRNFVRHSAAIHIGAVGTAENAAEQDVLRVLAIYHMAAFAEDWEIAHALLLLVSPWFERQGRLGELLEEFETMSEHTQNGEKVINTGNAAYLYQQLGNYEKALAIHTENERWLRAHPEFPDYKRNLFSAVIARLDCLVNLNRLEDSQPLLREAQIVLASWDNPMPDAELSILGNEGEILRRQGKYEAAIRVFERAIGQAKAAGVEQIHLKLVYALAACAAEFDDYPRATSALAELEKTADLGSNDELYSKYLDLKAKILEARGSDSFVQYFFESYEVDLARGDAKGVAASLFHLVRHYVLSGDKARAEEKMPELRRRAIQLGSADLLELVAELEDRLRN